MVTIDYAKVGIVNRWVDQNYQHMKRLYPEASEKKIRSFLYKKVEERIKVPKATITNSYAKKKHESDLLSIVEWIEQTKPIISGFGCLFKNQHEQPSPNAHMLDNFMTLRKVFKDQLEELMQDSFEYRDVDQKQLNEKINANSYYGCSGAPSSRFFNLATAASTTLTGQSLISTSAQAFESFMENNVLFYDMNNCMDFMHNILSEESKTDSGFLERVSHDMVYVRLKGMFYNYKDSYDNILPSYLDSLTSDQLKRIYYKNNLYEFTQNPFVHSHTMDVMNKVSKFLNPNSVPLEIESQLEELWTLYEEYVFYNHSPFGRVQRLRHHNGRKSVVVVDTDSNMLDLSRWVEFCDREFKAQSGHLQGMKHDDYNIIMVNIMCYYLTRLIEDVLKKYTTSSNVPEDYRGVVAMKNEFLFTKMLIGTKKKRYIVSAKLREGVLFEPEIVDIKGFDFIKSTTRKQTKDKFLDIINERIIEPDKTDILGSIRDLREFDEDIQNSMLEGNKDFLLPAKAKNPSAYKEPLRERVVRGVIVWDAVYPHNKVENEEQVDMVLVNMDTIDDVVGLKDTHPEIYESLRENIYESPNPEIRKKGVYVISIPRVIEKIPEWIIPYINIRDMVNRNISKFNPVLESLEMCVTTMDNSTFYSNIKTLG